MTTEAATPHQTNEPDKKLDLLTSNPVYKPFRYPWAYDAWLTQQRLHWLPEEVPLADDVKDWHRVLNDNERNLVTQIFRFFTQSDVEVNNCFREGTEILTTSGWKKFENLSDTDMVAQVNPDGRSEFVKPLSIISQPAPSRLIRFGAGGRGIDITVTENHDMVVDRFGELKKIQASKYPNSENYTQPMTAGLAKNGSTLTPFERILIAYQADARASAFAGLRKDYATITFRFKAERKISRLTHLAAMLGDCNFRTQKSDDGVTTLRLDIRTTQLGKGFEWVNLDSVTRSWCNEFVEELSHWDGHDITDSDIQWRNTNELAADMVQAVATLAGLRARKMQVSVGEPTEHYLVSITNWTHISTCRIEKSYIIPEASEKVWCVTVPSGMILVRSEGMTVVSGNCYMKHYSRVFKPTEVLMMLSAFSNIETIHIAAYSHLLDTLGMPETEYSAFLKYKEMKDKYDYMQGFSVDNKHEIAKTLAAFGAFTEGLQLFASFAILMNFPRFNKLKGMGQIVSWSVRDESIHCLSVIKLFRTFVQENPGIWTDQLQTELREICATIVEHEEAFIDLAFNMGEVEGLNAQQVKDYIHYIADRRLTQLGLEPLYNTTTNPLPWMDEMLNAVEHTNFFENRATEYSRASTTGTWEEAFEEGIFGL